jgi:chromosome partitioning protein
MLVSISTSKGGAGKSTLTAILSTFFFTHRQIKCCIIDLDPQESIIDTRKKELTGIKNNPPKPNSLYYQAIYKNQENMKKPFLDIFRIELSEDFDSIESKINKLKEDYDVVFLDFPGSLNLHINTLLILKMLDVIFIPYYADQNGNSSTMKFIKGLIDLKKNKKIHANFHVLFNRYQKVKNNENFKDSREFFITNNISLLNNVVYESTEVERYSTIIPLKPSNSEKNISHIAEEILNILKLK